ncbi:MAG: hypothetical protein M1818_004533 [Claussenomyces sp. TS43310]|nr:MAG: hypothetical protein M1818_004533 [Claussenomyces sp. TS43310]
MAPPGIFFTQSRLTAPDKVSPELYLKWFKEEHVPDLMKASGAKSFYFLQSLDANDEWPYLTYFPVDDLDYIHSEAFQNLPRSSDMLPAPHTFFDFAEFEMRSYEHLHTLEPAGRPTGPIDLVLAAGLEPAPGTDDDFNAWYAQEHLHEASKAAGHRRSRRYKLTSIHVFGKHAEGSTAAAAAAAAPPTYLALHEFDGAELPWPDLVKTLDTPWAKKSMGGCVKTETGQYRLLKVFGDVDAPFHASGNL